MIWVLLILFGMEEEKCYRCSGSENIVRGLCKKCRDDDDDAQQAQNFQNILSTVAMIISN